MTPEGKVVADIKAAMKELGCAVRKCQWVGHVGAPDLFIMVPGTVTKDAGHHFWVEVKAPGEKPKPHQVREHKAMEQAGCRVYVHDNAADVVRRVQFYFQDDIDLFRKAIRVEIECRQRVAQREAKNARGKKDTV